MKITITKVFIIVCEGTYEDSYILPGVRVIDRRKGYSSMNYYYEGFKIIPTETSYYFKTLLDAQEYREYLIRAGSRL